MTLYLCVCVCECPATHSAVRAAATGCVWSEFRIELVWPPCARSAHTRTTPIPGIRLARLRSPNGSFDNSLFPHSLSVGVQRQRLPLLLQPGLRCGPDKRATAVRQLRNELSSHYRPSRENSKQSEESVGNYSSCQGRTSVGDLIGAGRARGKSGTYGIYLWVFFQSPLEIVGVRSWMQFCSARLHTEIFEVYR